MARRRTLRPEEQDLWHAVARTARPMHARHSILPPAPETPPPALQEPAPAQITLPRLSPFHLGERARSQTKIDLAPTLAEAPVQMDAKAFTRMTRGKLVPEARIDLHGMTLAEAHPELIRFVLNAQSSGLRLVLVITGKGKGSPDQPYQRGGVLRHQVPHWLRLPPLGPAVLQLAEAHLKHGGSGAFYVYLRRAR